MFNYLCYGFCIDSFIKLPELEKGPGKADVSIKAGEVPIPSEAADMLRYFRAKASKAFLLIRGVGAFHVKNGCEVVVDAAPETAEDTLRLCLLGPLLGILLHQRGILTLHGSTVVINGSSAVILGNKGAGKSTLAAALHTQGHSIAADDIVAFSANRNKRSVPLSGIPRVKLWPDAVKALGINKEDFRQIHSASPKLWRKIGDGFARNPPPTKYIYVVEDGPVLALEKLGKNEAFIELVKHCYALRFLGSSGLTSTHFSQCAELAGSVAVSRLKRPRSIDLLPGLLAFVKKSIINTDNHNIPTDRRPQQAKNLDTIQTGPQI